MESINPVTGKKFTNKDGFKTLVEELKGCHRRSSKQNYYLKSKLGVESKSNEDILRKTKALCNSILENKEVTEF